MWKIFILATIDTAFTYTLEKKKKKTTGGWGKKKLAAKV